MLLISFFFALSLSIVVGLDFGAENIKIGLALLGKGVHVAINQHNKRLTPSYFAFWNTSCPNQTVRASHWSIADVRACSWAYDEDAYDHYLKYPQNVFRGLTSICDNYNGLMRREAYALLLHHLFKTIDSGIHEPISTHVVFAVDPDMPRHERYTLHEIIKMSGANLKSIVDAPSAAANLYALEKSQLYKSAPKTVVFVDVGAEKTWMSIFTFKTTPGNPIVKQLSLVSNISVGGHIIDERLSQFLLQKFADEINTTEPLPEKVQMLFLNEARNVKEQLSLHQTVDIKIEDVFENRNFEYTIERSQFEELFGDFNETLTNAFIELIDKAYLVRDDIESVELLGGTTRVPFIQDILLEVSGIGRLNRTMNADEAIALGAGYIGAAESADFLAAKKVKVDPFCNTYVQLVHNGNKIDLFNKTNRISDTNSYEFKSRDNSNITILVDQEYPPETEIVKFYVKLPKTALGNVTVHLDFGFDEMTLPGIYNIMINKLTIREIEFYQPPWSMTKLNYNRSVAFIKRIDDIIEERRQTQESFNNFEAYLYQVKERVANEAIIKEVTTDEEINQLSIDIDKNIQWLLNETHKMPLTTRIIGDRQNQLKKRIDDIDLRASELNKREPAFQGLWNKIQEVCKAINETWPIERPWMPEKARNDMKSAVDHALKYYYIYKEQQGNRTSKESPGVLAQEVEMQTYYLSMTYNFTLRTTKNPPTPKPPKTPNPYVKTYSTVDEFEKDVAKQRERDIFGL